MCIMSPKLMKVTLNIISNDKCSEYIKDPEYSIIGVTSFGRFCGYAYSPAIYIRVSSYIPWIESVVWGQNKNL
ncbi:hypothetical protein NQ314_004195 [Rhamnusium bicolor]|uniref:Peptidase S1 domain-containing protein n=1 Tax=Rhamnusium bicolor TaxID=1586634 RepID=A0AAV8ZN90_9CUCU|nr:hypothetical protein NQ314_004195 [Rhamnusium bicolor]